jgi:hypothetical protein
MGEPRPAITPELEVSELLDSYPELEPVLLGPEVVLTWFRRR